MTLKMPTCSSTWWVKLLLNKLLQTLLTGIIIVCFFTYIAPDLFFNVIHLFMVFF